VKWISHKGKHFIKVLPKHTTFAIYYIILEASIQSLLAPASSIIPDAIEMRPGRTVFCKHRGTSHNPLLWCLALPVLLYPLKKMFMEIPITVPEAHIQESKNILRVITIGIMLHLAAHSLSDSAIPLIGIKRIALKIYRTFTLSEFAGVSFVIISCGICLGLRRFLFS
jgi:hypothetical protein